MVGGKEEHCCSRRERDVSGTASRGDCQLKHVEWSVVTRCAAFQTRRRGVTPKHQQIIDTTLRELQERAMVLQRALSIPSANTQEREATQEEPRLARSVEALRASPLGQKLRWIAEYVEGYPAAVEPERRTPSIASIRSWGNCCTPHCCNFTERICHQANSSMWKRPPTRSVLAGRRFMDGWTMEVPTGSTRPNEMCSGSIVMR